MSRKTFLIIILLLSLVRFSSAQESDSVHIKRFKIYPLPAIGYAPETRWYVGAVALMNIRFTDDTLIKSSSVETEFNITQNKQWVVTANFDLRLDHENYILTGENGYYDFPEDYWGIGVEAAEENKISYDASRFEIDNSLLRKILKNNYAGLRYRYHYMKTSNISAPGKLLNEPFTYKTSGAGVVFLNDSRDNIFNATKGMRIYFSTLFFQKWLGGDYSFTKLDFDFRTYFTIHKKGVLAGQLVSSNNYGTAPFRMLPMMGSESIMRGYYQGRYRDNHLLAAQIEYRTVIWKWIGATAFAGTGTVYDKGVFEDGYQFLPSYGAGLRVRVDKKDNINLRFDYGVGKNMTGFYVSFGEAF